MKTQYLESVELSDIGRRRKNNEDACLAMPEQGVFCVADGMGGVIGGDLASEAVTTSIREAFIKQTPSIKINLTERIRIFLNSVNSASKWIKKFADEKVIGQMGSTVVALVFDPSNPTRAMGIHAGDSRLYMFRNRRLKVLTTDHTAVVALAAKLGRDPDSLPAKYQNELLRAVGLAESVEMELTPVEVLSGDLFLLCTDGLTRMVSDDRIAAILKRAEKEALDSVAKMLVDAANLAGGKDNITVVLVRIRDITGLPLLPVPVLEEGPKTAAGEKKHKTEESPCPPTPSGPPLTSDTDEELRGDTPHTYDSPPTITPEKRPVAVPPSAPNVSESKSPAPSELLGTDRALIKRDQGEIEAAEAPSPLKPAIEIRGETGQAAELKLRITQTVKLVALVLLCLGLTVGGYVGWQHNQKTEATKRLTAYQTALQAARTALADRNFEIARTRANEALRLKPGDAEASRLKEEAEANAEKLQIDRQLDQKYQEAIRFGRDLFDNQDYAGALAKADEALRLKAGGTEATQLRQQSQAKLDALKAAQQREQQYQAAIQAGQALFHSQDYTGALTKADEALRLKAGGIEATQLRQQSQAKLDELKAAQQRKEQYQLALRTAQDALTRKDYITARTQAESALKWKPDDPAAMTVRTQAIELPELAVAQHYFDQGDYSRAAEMVRQYSGSDLFKQLAMAIQTESNALATAQARFRSGDYALIDEVKQLAFGSKLPFAKLVTDAQAEADLLRCLEGIKQTNGWAVLQTNLAALAPAVRSKPPFRALQQWAQVQSAQPTGGDVLDRLDAEFEMMLVWFNVVSPKDPYLRTAEARKQSRLHGEIGVEQRQKHLDNVKRLKIEFQKGGWLNQRERDRYLDKLLDTIIHRE